jgi:hypothetical protein
MFKIIKECFSEVFSLLKEAYFPKGESEEERDLNNPKYEAE